MLTLVFVFMLFNLTSIWNLPTISTGDHGRYGVRSLVGAGARFFIRGHVMEAATRDTMPCCANQFGKSHLPSQSDRSPPYPIWA
jgi:hypothetical protein